MRARRRATLEARRLEERRVMMIDDGSGDDSDIEAVEAQWAHIVRTKQRTSMDRSQALSRRAATTVKIAEAAGEQRIVLHGFEDTHTGDSIGDDLDVSFGEQDDVNVSV
jgi:hypothetical protein